MNVVVKHDGTDISNWLLSYNREQEICTGIGTVEVIVPSATPRTFHPWDVIEIWENGDKKGKYYISDLDKSAKEGIITLLCDDESKKLNDYFVVESYSITTLQYSRPWIEKFLSDAGVSYTFTVSGNGVPLSNNTTLGFDTAFSILTTLLQQSGWYIYFDPDGTAIVGDLHKDVNNPDHTITSDDFTNFERELDDDRLRNRAVVWGNTNPTYGEVFVDISVQTPWNYDAQDKRAVVIANGSIYNHAQALELAQKLLKEFTQIKDEKAFIVINDYNIQLGDILKVNSNVWNGRGLVTKIVANASSDGLIYGITLDTHCPRMFTFYSELPPTISGFYVYTGHISDGIWRKHSEGSTFSQDSAGLEPGAKVDDLFIKNGTFATVLDDGYLYTRTSENGVWNKYTPPNLRDINGVEYNFNTLQAHSCSINYSDNIIVGYNYVASGTVASGIPASGLSWVLELTGAQTLVKAEQVVVSGAADYGGNFTIYDLESTGEYNVVALSGYIPISGFYPDAVEWYRTNGLGTRDIQIFHASNFYNQYEPTFRALPADKDSIALGFGYGLFSPSTVTGSDVISSVVTTPGIICDDDLVYWYAGIDGLCKIDMINKTSTLYSWTAPAEWYTAVDIYNIAFFLRKKTSTTFDVVAVVNTKQSVGTTAGSNEVTFYHCTYTLGGSLSAPSSASFSNPEGGGFWFSGTGLVGDNIIIGYVTNEDGYNLRTQIYNLNSHGLSNALIAHVNDYTESGSNFSTIFTSTGIGIFAGWTFLTFTDEYNYGGFPFPEIGYLTANLYGCGVHVTKAGAILTTAPTLLRQFETFDGPATTYWQGGEIQPSDQPSASHTILNTSYVFTGIELEEHTRFGATHWYGVTSVYSVPSFTEHYFHITDRWTQAEAGSYNGGTNVYFKEAGDIGLKAAGVTAQSSNLRDPIFFLDNNFYEGWYESRNAQSWSNMGRFSSIYWNIQDDRPMDDFTGQVGFGSTKLSGEVDDMFVASLPSNLNSWNMKADVNTAGGAVGYSQNFIISCGQRYRIHYLGSNYMDDYPTGSVLKHTSTYNLGDKITASDLALEQTLGVFEIIKTTRYPVKVDIAHGVPTVIYDIPKNDASPITEDFWASIINENGSFYTHADPKPVYEARTLNLVNPQNFPTASGTLTATDYERYIGIVNREGFLASEYDLSTPWVNLVTVASGVIPSGLITHFETTNFVPEGAYIFYTVSGVKSFFQKNADENFWRDYSATLPDSPITIIRVDDVI